MIKKYRYGEPIETDAVIEKIEETKSALDFFEKTENGFTKKLGKNERVYGLGEQVRGINKRGWQYVSYNYDNPNHEEDTHSLYGAHNFLIFSGEEIFGVFFDYPGKLTFDIGYTDNSVITVTPETENLDVYIITGKDEKDIVKQFRKIIGKSYIPPEWAFGFGQSRWGYKTEEDIREVARRYKEKNIPLSMIYLDIDYMKDYEDFTVDEEKFADIKKLSDDLKKDGIHLVPIIDAGVKIEKGYELYEEGVKNNYFCKDTNGNDFVGAVWPGRVHFPDFMQKETRDWFGKKYGRFIEMGIEGFWNDMNEPAIFYTEDRLQETLDKIQELSKSNMGIVEYFDFTGTVAGLNGNTGDYTKFTHKMGDKTVLHKDIHNLYGMNMTRSASEAIKEMYPDKKVLFFSRSSYIGAHRYGGIWQGDNKSWWSHILLNFQQLPSLNMCGFLFIGSDIGGFGCDTTEDLLMRWMQMSVFTPLMRNHSADGTRLQELYQFRNCDDLKKIVEIRYALIPYLTKVYMNAAENDEMMFRPLAFDYADDEMACRVEDQLMFGNEMMLAPIYTQNAEGRYVYLPEDMYLVRMRGVDDYDVEKMSAGHSYVSAKLNEMIFFVKNKDSLNNIISK
ncbi:MAG: glycoside hydrolase family 31 protein [Oscillospiraceae bacterium]|nr:glycoside hydrolase family 31 protein [Oscillospiraceae bacterium]